MGHLFREADKRHALELKVFNEDLKLPGEKLSIWRITRGALQSESASELL